MVNRIYVDIETYGNTIENMFTGKIISIGCKINDNEIQVLKEWKSSEEDIINKILHIFTAYKKSELIGYNILHFDIPYIVNRATKYKLDSSENLLKITSDFYNIDLLQAMLYINNFRYYGISAIDVASRYNLSCFKNNYKDGSKMIELYDKKLYSEIEKHNIEDIIFNERLYLLLRNT